MLLSDQFCLGPAWAIQGCWCSLLLHPQASWGQGRLGDANKKKYIFCCFLVPNRPDLCQLFASLWKGYIGPGCLLIHHRQLRTHQYVCEILNTCPQCASLVTYLHWRRSFCCHSLGLQESLFTISLSSSHLATSLLIPNLGSFMNKCWSSA